MSSARHGRRRPFTGAGAHPQRELTLMPRLGFHVLGSAWPQAPSLADPASSAFCSEPFSRRINMAEPSAIVTRQC